MAIGMVMCAAMLALGGTAASAQTANSPGTPTETATGNDTSRSVNADRDQQFALDQIRDEAGTTTGRRPSRRNANQVIAATPADLKVGAQVFDIAGVTIGSIEAVKPDGVQLLAGSSRAMVPAEVFGKTAGKLVLNVTKAEFEKQTGAK